MFLFDGLRDILYKIFPENFEIEPFDDKNLVLNQIV